jgi:transcriptional regulator with XRE-family HTH domain
MTRGEVRRLRRLLGLTQAAFAEKVGVERVTVARWECGLSPVNRTAAILIRLLAQQARPPRQKRRT